MIANEAGRLYTQQANFATEEFPKSDVDKEVRHPSQDESTRSTGRISKDRTKSH